MRQTKDALILLISCRYAVRNTSRGVETCGVLAGQLDEKSGLFKICTLILPKQTGTSDTVETLNEEEVFDLQVWNFGTLLYIPNPYDRALCVWSCPQSFHHLSPIDCHSLGSARMERIDECKAQFVCHIGPPPPPGV